MFEVAKDIGKGITYAWSLLPDDVQDKAEAKAAEEIESLFGIHPATPETMISRETQQLRQRASTRSSGSRYYGASSGLSHKRTTTPRLMERAFGSAGNVDRRSRLTGGPPAVLGSNLIVTGEQELTTIVSRLGPRIKTPRSYMFQNYLTGSGEVVSQFSYIVCPNMNHRHYHFDIFRHNLCQAWDENNVLDGVTVSKPYTYSTTALPRAVGTSNLILSPSQSAVGVLPMTLPGVSNAVGGSMFVMPDSLSATDNYDLGVNATIAFSELNLPDLEDMSWNMNNLKLKHMSAIIEPSASTGNPADPSFVPGGESSYVRALNNAPGLLQHAHRSQSLMYQNNSPGLMGTVGEIPPTWSKASQFNAVINYGGVDYRCANKGAGPAKVEFVIFRIKRDAKFAPDASNYTFGKEQEGVGAAFKLNPINDSIEALMNRYLIKNRGRFATDALQGESPASEDITHNPKFAFLPDVGRAYGQANRTSINATLPAQGSPDAMVLQPSPQMVEVDRAAFILPSGCKREYKLHFPGICYDPCSVGMQAGLGPTVENVYFVAPMHKYTHIVAVAVSGCQATLHMFGKTTDSSGDAIIDCPIGDSFSEANVQITGRYFEKLSACIAPRKVNYRLYCEGVNNPSTDPIGDTVPPIPMRVAPIVSGLNNVVIQANHAAVGSTLHLPAGASNVQNTIGGECPTSTVPITPVIRTYNCAPIVGDPGQTGLTCVPVIGNGGEFATQADCIAFIAALPDPLDCDS